MDAVVRGIERLSTCLAYVSMGGIFLMMVIVVVDVMLRTFFGSSLLLAEEVCGYLLVAVALFAYAEALKRDSHVRVDMIFCRLAARARSRLDLAFCLLSVGAIAVVTWATVVMVYRAYARGVIVPGILLTPVWIPQAAMVIGLGAVILQLLIEIRKLARQR